MALVKSLPPLTSPSAALSKTTLKIVSEIILMIPIIQIMIIKPMPDRARDVAVSIYFRKFVKIMNTEFCLESWIQIDFDLVGNL